VEKPNIVIIMTDQQRADFSAAEGFPLDTTPAVDRLGREGVRFRRAYSSMPVCAPARCSMLSGRFPKATRVRENGGIRNMYCAADLTDVLRDSGYSINLCGKNHSHLKPEELDFASLYMHHGAVGGARGHQDGSGRPPNLSAQEREMDSWLAGLDHGVSTTPTPFPLECQPPYRVVRDAIECLENRGDRPFFLWLSFAEPHNPYQVPEPYFSLFPEDRIPDRAAGPEAAAAKGEKWRWLQNLIREKRPQYEEQWRRYRANYCGMIRLIDDQIGRFLEYLAETKLRESTMIIFTSDHGDFAGDYGLQRKGVELPECLIRIPLLFTGPGIVAAGQDAFVSIVDIFPTLCEAVGAAMPDGVQGRSLWPMLRGESWPEEEFRSIYAEHGFGGLHYGEEERPALHFPYGGPTFDELNSVTQSGTLKMVRMGRWKLEYDMMGRGRLYDVESDPTELVDLYRDPELAEAKTQLLEELLKWTIRTEDDLPHGVYVQKRAERNWYAAHDFRP